MRGNLSVAPSPPCAQQALECKRGDKAFFEALIDSGKREDRRLIVVACERGDLPRDLDPDAMTRVRIALFQGFVLQLAWDGLPLDSSGKE